MEDLRKNRLLGPIDLPFLAAHRRYTLAMQRKAMGIAEKMAAIQTQLDRAKRESRRSVETEEDSGEAATPMSRWREEIERRDVAEMDEIAMRLGHDQLIHADTGSA